MGDIPNVDTLLQAGLENWQVAVPWLIAAALLLYAYVASKRNRKPKLQPDTKRSFFTGITQLGVAKKLRGFRMGRKQQREREEFVREYISMQWLLVVEHAWASGLITKDERDKYTDDLAFKFSDKSMFANTRLKFVKAKARKTLKELREQRAIPFPDLTDISTATTKEGEGATKIKPALVKAA